MDWLKIPYIDYGRTLSGCDCWGLVRLVRESIRGDLLPSYGSISPRNKEGLTTAALEVVDSRSFTERQESEVRPGAIATCWRGPLCLHVGIVIEADGRMAVLETGRKIGPRWKWLPDFTALYPTVRYYDND
jgi:cell wall-associated NlpC family hydrolase